MLTRDDLRETTAELKGYIAERVGRVEAELHELNLTVNRHAVELAEFKTRVRALERRGLSPRVLVGLVAALGLALELAHRAFAMAAQALGFGR
jgi:hypothetical protein